VAIRECSFLGVPAVNVGTRQQGRERGRNVIDVDHDREAIAAAIREHVRRGRPERDDLYGDGRAGERIADTLARSELRIEKRLTY
jgi:UDP-N-acetylglucosamine 2-epimerase